MINSETSFASSSAYVQGLPRGVVPADQTRPMSAAHREGFQCPNRQIRRPEVSLRCAVLSDRHADRSLHGAVGLTAAVPAQMFWAPPGVT